MFWLTEVGPLFGLRVLGVRVAYRYRYVGALNCQIVMSVCQYVAPRFSGSVLWGFQTSGHWTVEGFYSFNGLDIAYHVNILFLYRYRTHLRAFLPTSMWAKNQKHFIAKNIQLPFRSSLHSYFSHTSILTSGHRPICCNIQTSIAALSPNFMLLA